MPLQKFRRVEDMPPAPPLPEGPERVQRLRAFWAGWARLVRPLGLRGLRRYRTLEEADADRAAAVRRRAERHARELGRRSPEGR